MIQAGQVLAGRYKLLRPLGQGSQAFVWVAEHLALGSHVAVKLIDPDLAKQDDARQRFAREASAAAKLRSTHVVQIHDHGIEGDQPFIVMELLEGEDLFDRLDRMTRLTGPETSRIVTQVARALMRAHAEGIIHRDLKPENVFIVKNEDDELVKVLDFGVAKITTPQKSVMVKTGVGTLIGTPHYMSPEQVKGVGDIDHRSDLWSLGVIAYQCVTGSLPFDSEGVGDLLIRITMNVPVLPSVLAPDVEPGFDDWFKKACAKDPDDRFQTSREMADALARAVAVSPVSEPPTSRVHVSLADSPDLDWGSLAGVRIPLPPKRFIVTGDQVPPAPTSRRMASPPPIRLSLDSSPGDDDLAGLSAEQEPQAPNPPARRSPDSDVAGASSAPPATQPSHFLEEQRIEGPISVNVELAAPPPPPPPPPPRVVASSAPLISPPTSAGGALGHDIPFLRGDEVSPVRSVGPAPRVPAVAGVDRGAHSTVDGVSAYAQASDAPPSRGRRATWYVTLGVVGLGAVGFLGVVRSRGGFEEVFGTRAAPSLTGAPLAPLPSPSATSASSSVSAAPSVSASASATPSSEFVDVPVTKKSTAPPPVRPSPGIRKKPADEDGGYDIPMPTREAP